MSGPMYVTYSLDGGGAERLLTNIILQQPEPERVVVVTLRANGVFRAQLEGAGVYVTDLGMSEYHHVVRGMVRLARLVRRFQPRVVHSWDYFANLLAFFACKLTFSNARIFWGQFGTGFGTRKLKLQFRLALLLNILLSRHVDGVTYNAAASRDYHRAIGFCEPRAIVISNSIDGEAFRHDPEQRDTIRRSMGVAPHQIIVTIIARIDPMKDWPSMLAAVRGLPNVITVAIGHRTETLPQQDGLITIGWRADIASMLSAADIFLLGSAYGEGTSLAVCEAMLCGLPCVVTDVGDNGTLVGECGIVIPPRDVTAMRTAISALANDREQRETLGHRARKRASEIALHDGRMQQIHDLSMSEAS